MVLLQPLNPRVRDWAGRRVWIVGSSSGIGAALARRLLELGARVALSARGRDRLGAVANGHPRAVVVPMDAAVPGTWSVAYGSLVERWDAIDLVVFCAAQYQPERSWEIRSERVREMIAVNLASVYYGLEAVLPAMLAARSGSLAVVASVAGYVGLPQATVYGPTKAALINLAELLYAELHPKGLGVYLINPGFVRTALTARNSFPMPALLTPERAVDHILDGFARGRFEIDFPHRFTRPLRILGKLPHRWRFALLRWALGIRGGEA